MPISRMPPNNLRQFASVLMRACALALLACYAPNTCADTRADIQSKSTANSSAPITLQDVDDAIVKVKADPNLSQEKTVRTLRWKSDQQEQRKRSRLGWLSDLLSFLAQTGRVIVWLIIGVAVAVLVVVIIKIVRGIRPGTHATSPTAPTHVRDLDIRPESLPDDIGAAALALWEQGEHRAALALLYRGLLSRLVHIHAVPIRHSSTEGDCLDLAVQRLPGERSAYVTQVIRVWQRAVYGAQTPQNADVQILCAGFATALDQSVASPAQ